MPPSGRQVPLAGPTDHVGVGLHRVLDRGDEANVAAAWVEEHEPSPSFVRADSPDAAEHRVLIEHDHRRAREASFAMQLQSARTHDQRAELRIREREQLAADARARQASTTTGSAA